MKLMQECPFYLVVNEYSHVSYKCESLEQARRMAIKLEEKTRWLWCVHRSWHDAESINVVLKAIARHNEKEFKRNMSAVSRATKALNAVTEKLNKMMKKHDAMFAAIKWRENVVDGYDFRMNQSSAHNMTKEEEKEWADKFFSAL